MDEDGQQQQDNQVPLMEAGASGSLDENGIEDENFQLQQQESFLRATEEATEFAKVYVSRLNKFKKQICACWIAVFLICALIAPNFLQVVLLIFEPPPHTDGYEAQHKFDTYFPGASREWDIIILINSKDKSPLFESEHMKNQTRAFVEQVEHDLIEHGEKKVTPATTFMVVHYFQLESEFKAHALARMLLDDSANPENATAMLMTAHKVHGFKSGSMEGNAFVDWLDERVEKLRKKYVPHLEAQATGLPSFVRDMQEGSEKDMMKMDSLSLPIAFGLLSWVLRSVRLLIIPLTVVSLVISISFALMYPIALSTNVIAVCPSVMMSVGLAFTIDFQLFELSRFREEILAKNTVENAVVLMIESAGHTILVSGSTITICWLGLMSFPVSLLSSIGMGAAITVTVAFIVSVTLTPVMLLNFPDFFSNFENFGCVNCFGSKKSSIADFHEEQEGQEQHQQQQQQSSSSYSNSQSNTLLRRPSSMAESPCAFDGFGRRSLLTPDMARSPAISGFATPASGIQRTPVLNPDGTVLGDVASPVFGMIDPVEELTFLKDNSRFYKCGDCLFGNKTRALIMALVTSAIILPLAPYAVDFHHSESFKLFTPSDSEATHAALRIESLYGGGRLAPYQLLIEAPEDVSVLSEKFFEHVQDVVESVILPLDYGHSMVPLEREGIAGMMLMNGYNVSLTYNILDPQRGPSVTGCLFDGLELALGLCAKAKCEKELTDCEHDNDCNANLKCLDSCRGEPICTAKCFLNLPQLDSASWKLAQCTLQHCVVDPVIHPPSRKPTSLALSSSSSQKNKDSVKLVTVGGSQVNLAAQADYSSKLPEPDCPSILLQFVQSIHGVRPKASWIMMNLIIDPYSKEGTDWLDSFRERMKEQSKVDGYGYYLLGGDVNGHDVVNKVFDLLPIVLLGILGIVVLFLGFSFKSAFLPLPTIYTILLTLIFVYGIGVLTYEHDLLGWTHARALTNPYGNQLTWLVPAMSGIVTTGLSIDYSCFGYARIFEYRFAGFRTVDAILAGSSQTASVVSAAGLIMFVAFAGLSLSSNSALNQLSFFLCTAVLVDTFVIRIFVTPALMVLAGELNWWPTRPASLEY